MFIVMWTWSRGSAILTAQDAPRFDPDEDLIKMLEKSKPVRVPGTAIFLTSDPSVAPSSLMHNLKHNKVLHERVVMMCVKTEPTPRVHAAHRFEDGAAVARLPLADAPFRLHGIAARAGRAGGAAQDGTEVRHHDDVVLPRPPHAEAGARIPGMPKWQDHLFIALAKQAASAPDFFNIPSDRVVELGAQMKV